MVSSSPCHQELLPRERTSQQVEHRTRSTASSQMLRTIRAIVLDKGAQCRLGRRTLFQAQGVPHLLGSVQDVGAIPYNVAELVHDSVLRFLPHSDAASSRCC